MHEELKVKTKAELEKLYEELYGRKRKFATKKEVVDIIINRYRIISRAKAFRVGEDE